MAMTTSNVLIGKEKICAYLDIGKKTFRKLVADGMPARKKAGRWVAHKEILDDYFRGCIVNDPAPDYSQKKHP